MPKVDESQGVAAVRFLNLPVLAPADAAGQRSFYDSQFDFGSYVGCHPCFENPTKHTTVYFTGAEVDIAVPFGQFIQHMNAAGTALAQKVEEHKSKQIILARELPR